MEWGTEGTPESDHWSLERGPRAGMPRRVRRARRALEREVVRGVEGRGAAACIEDDDEGEGRTSATGADTGVDDEGRRVAAGAEMSVGLFGGEGRRAAAGVGSGGGVGGIRASKPRSHATQLIQTSVLHPVKAVECCSPQ